MDILICDDEPLAIERLARLVSQLGHTVVATATHGQQALDLAHQHEPDVILLDIQMPEMDGLRCAQHLRQLDPMPAIVFVRPMTTMRLMHSSRMQRLLAQTSDATGVSTGIRAFNQTYPSSDEPTKTKRKYGRTQYQPPSDCGKDLSRGGACPCGKYLLFPG